MRRKHDLLPRPRPYRAAAARDAMGATGRAEAHGTPRPRDELGAGRGAVGRQVEDLGTEISEIITDIIITD